MDLKAEESEKRNKIKTGKRIEEKLYGDIKKKKKKKLFKMKDDSCNGLIPKSIEIEYLFLQPFISSNKEKKNKKKLNFYH